MHSGCIHTRPETDVYPGQMPSDAYRMLLRQPRRWGFKSPLGLEPLHLRVTLAPADPPSVPGS